LSNAERISHSHEGGIQALPYDTSAHELWRKLDGEDLKRNPVKDVLDTLLEQRLEAHKPQSEFLNQALSLSFYVWLHEKKTDSPRNYSAEPLDPFNRQLRCAIEIFNAVEANDSSLLFTRFKSEPALIGMVYEMMTYDLIKRANELTRSRFLDPDNSNRGGVLLTGIEFTNLADDINYSPPDQKYRNVRTGLPGHDITYKIETISKYGQRETRKKDKCGISVSTVSDPSLDLHKDERIISLNPYMVGYVEIAVKYVLQGKSIPGSPGFFASNEGQKFAQSIIEQLTLRRTELNLLLNGNNSSHPDQTLYLTFALNELINSVEQMSVS